MLRMMMIFRNIQLLSLFIAVSGIHGFPPTLTSFESMLVHCCGIGTSWARNHTTTTCTGPQWPIPQVSVNDRMACATAIYICCIRFHRVANCDRGKHAAQTGQACSVLPIAGGETYKDCCDGCSLGLKAGSLRMACSASNLAFGTPWEQAYEDCCVNAVTNPGTSSFTNSGLVGKSCEIDKPCDQICEDKGGSARCSCFLGYRLSSDQRSCEDVDECSTGVCDASTEVCLNTVGSYTCVPRRSDVCPPGFKLQEDTGRCIDVDECAEGVHQCDPETELCSNTMNGYQCIALEKGKECPAGFKRNELSALCEDVNECIEQPDICDSNDHECRNTIGGYECDYHCGIGMMFDEQKQECVDIDECALALHDCKPDETCQNESPSYRCISDIPKLPCPAGYKPTPIIDGAQPSCVDVDECEEDLHSCAEVSEICVNEIGSYRCEQKQQKEVTPSCPPGTTLNEGRCEDVDECSTNQNNCHKDREICVNNFGGFRCYPKPSCMPGFTFNIETKSCADIDECSERTDNCNRATHDCVNEIGTYRCDMRIISCPPGYRRSTHAGLHGNCQDINECVERSDNCNRETHDCVNEVGTFRCDLRILPPCPRGFRRRTPTGSCEDIDECSERLDNCNRETQNCVNEPGTFRCEGRIIPPCPRGHRRRTPGSSCEDIDECSERLDNCNRETQNCVNEPGTFRCEGRIIPPCPRGHRRRTPGSSCEDIDECSERLDNCNRETQNCVNEPGTFRCEGRIIPPCPRGHRRRTPGSSCEDINECTDTENRHECDPVRQNCINTIGSYHCAPKPSSGRGTVQQCGIGYRPDSNTGHCRDINECEEQRPCLADQTCENNPGSYQCICQQGYTMDTITRTCKDVNECQLGLHSCADSQRCDNTVGSFTCVRTTSCGTGYTLHAGTSKCEDDDECLLSSHNCGADFVCRNTPGSFRCDRVRCPIGQRLLSDGSCQVIICNKGTELDATGNCVDINECITNNPCRKNQRCINSFGSYRCQNFLNCGTGFELNELGNHCVDIDECARRTHDCKGDQVCRNRPGSYICECPAGYTLNAQRQCEDIDECARYRGQVCSASSECQNTQGSYVCNCNVGFKKAEDGRNCIDIDECIESPNICHQTCFNFWGSYKCLCKQGYTLAPDGRTCLDIDECSMFEGKGNLCIGFCVNEPGSYSCSCPDGYRLSSDKRTCQDIDECQEQSHCKGENEVCLNTRGGYKCNIITCPSNYERDRDHRNRCTRSSVECQHGDAECLKEPLSISYNYITFVSNMRIPPSGQLDLFTMRGPRYTFTTVQFNLELKDARAGYGTVAATRQYFHLRRTAFNEAMVSLIKPIPGPQELELELSMKMYHNNQYGGTAIARLYIVVSAHEF